MSVSDVIIAAFSFVDCGMQIPVLSTTTTQRPPATKAQRKRPKKTHTHTHKRRRREEAEQGPTAKSGHASPDPVLTAPTATRSMPNTNATQTSKEEEEEKLAAQSPHHHHHHRSSTHNNDPNNPDLD
jgi:hypothetical protein